jgi:hypothetical protein
MQSAAAAERAHRAAQVLATSLVISPTAILSASAA